MALGQIPQKERNSRGWGAASICFVCSAIAVSAMILPGISGSFIFLLLGVYFDVLAAVDNQGLDCDRGCRLWAGCVGLLAFTRLLNYVLRALSRPDEYPS